MKRNLLILLLVILLAAILRISFLTNIPAGFSGDEAITGYSAYSILKTGKDEWGDLMPVTFRSFGDYKPGLYTYLTVPSIAIFGLSEFAVRLPAAIIGILSVVAVYFLAQLLFKNSLVVVFSALLLALSPWDIHFSRLAFEGILTTLLFPAGLLFYLKSLEKPKILPLAAIFWGLNLFSYLPARLFTIFVVLAILSWKRPKNLLMSTKLSTGVIALLTIILLIFSSRSGSLNRFYDISIFSSSLEPVKIAQYESPLPKNIARIFDNKATFYTAKFFENYLSYLSPQFLFTGERSGSSDLNLPGAPLIYGIEVIFLISALVFAIRNPKGSPAILLFWLILAPIPASLTKEGFHAHRAIPLLPVFSLISAYGAVNLVEFLKKKFNKNFTPIFIIIILAASIQFFQNYFFHLPKHPPEAARFGYKEAIIFTESIKDNYDKIFFTKANSEPQAFVAFYTQVNPKFYQENAQGWLKFIKEGKNYLDQLPEYSLGKYVFRDTIWSDVKDSKHTLVVAAAHDIPDNVKPLKIIKDPSGKEVFKIVATSQISN